MIKDIVQPKKTGGKRGTKRFASTSYSIADVFFGTLKGLVFGFKFEKNVTVFKALKRWSLFYVEYSTNNSEAH